MSAESYFIGGIKVSATITDTKSDSRCVYIDYKINAPKWYDGFDKLTRVCGNGDTDQNAMEWVGPAGLRRRPVQRGGEDRRLITVARLQPQNPGRPWCLGSLASRSVR